MAHVVHQDEDDYEQSLLEEQEQPKSISLISSCEDSETSKENEEQVEEAEAVVNTSEPVTSVSRKSLWHNVAEGKDDELPVMPSYKDNADAFVEELEMELLADSSFNQMGKQDGVRLVNKLDKIFRSRVVPSVERSKREADQQMKDWKNEQLEEKMLEEKIKEIKAQIRERELEYESLKIKDAKQLAKAKEKLEAAKKEHSTVKGKRREAQRVLKKWQDKRKRLKEEQVALQKKRQSIDNWCATHGVKFLIPNFDDLDNNANVGDAEILLEVFNIHPKCPQKTCHVRMGTLDIHEGRFKALNVLPNFVGAAEIVEQANESQDFIQCLYELRKHWRRLIESGNISPERQPMSLEQTGALFESPESSSAGDLNDVQDTNV